jgi:hypothetical protein
MKFGLLFFLSCSFIHFGNAQLVNYSGFSLNAIEDKVLVSITIDSGSICQGIQLEFSTDSLNFNKIDEIEGVCGSSSLSKSYSFLHTDPLKNENNYYRLVFGVSQRTEIKSIYIRYVLPGEIQVFPMPSNGNFSVYFSNPSNAKANWKIIDREGKVFFETNTVNSDHIELNKTNFISGLYFVQITDENQNKSTGKFTVF